MNNKKSLFAIFTLLIVIAIGVTFAVFNTQYSFTNKFDLGDYVVTTTEVFQSPDNWSPGDTIPKTLVTTNEGTISAAVRVSINESWTDADGNAVDINDIPNDAVTINFASSDHWIKNGDYYYYKYSLKAGDSTTTLTDSVTLNPELGSTNCVEDNGVESCTSSIGGIEGYHYTLTFTIQTAQYDKYQEIWNTDIAITEKPPLIQIMNSERTKDNLQVGDEVCINGDTTECFNFYGYDGNNMKLLSKYNLKVGKIYDSGGTETGSYSSSDTGYGLQSSEAKGYVDGQTRYGTVEFSATNYWYDGSSLKSKYGSSYPADVYDTDYKTEPNFSSSGFNTTGYSIAYYVEEYKKILEDYGVTIADARLLTDSEATSSSIGCSESNYNCPTNGFITNTSFWLGSAYDDIYLWNVYSDGDFNYSLYGYDSIRGVRPVIIISKSDI